MQFYHSVDSSAVAPMNIIDVIVYAMSRVIHEIHLSPVGVDDKRERRDGSVG